MTGPVLTTTGRFRTVDAGTWRTGALALFPLLDEWTGRPPPSAFAGSLTPGVHAHVTRGTLVLTGLATTAWPDLATVDQIVEVTVRRGATPPHRARLRIPAGATLPYQGPPLAVSSATIAVAGRVSAAEFPHGPVVDAAVELTGPTGAPLVAASVGVAAHHAAGSTVRVRPLPPGPATTLTASARSGDSTLRLASVAGLAGGSVLRVETGEFAVVDALTGTVAVLRLPLRTSPTAGSPVVNCTPGAPGAATTLTRDTVAGDAVWPVAAPLPPGTVEIVDGAATEFRQLGLRTDSDGRWRQPGVRGVARIRLTVTAAGFTTEGPTDHPLIPTDPFVIDTALRI